jgi:hypothetical protein
MGPSASILAFSNQHSAFSPETIWMKKQEFFPGFLLSVFKVFIALQNCFGAEC